VKQNKIS